IAFFATQNPAGFSPLRTLQAFRHSEPYRLFATQNPTGFSPLRTLQGFSHPEPYRVLATQNPTGFWPPRTYRFLSQDVDSWGLRGEGCGGGSLSMSATNSGDTGGVGAA